MVALPGILLGALSSMGMKLITEKFAKFLILKVIEAYVKSTKNTHDDEVFAKIKEAMGE